MNRRPVYDIVNRRGELFDRVQLPEFRTLAGFGPGVVYMAVKDSTGVVHVERARESNSRVAARSHIGTLMNDVCRPVIGVVALASACSRSAETAAAAAAWSRRPHIRPIHLPARRRHVPMPDGRVLVNDITARRVLLFDSTLTKASIVADTTGATANAYGTRAGTLIAYRGDSALYIDIGSLSMLVIGPTRKDRAHHGRSAARRSAISHRKRLRHARVRCGGAFGIVRPRRRR